MLTIYNHVSRGGYTPDYSEAKMEIHVGGEFNFYFWTRKSIEQRSRGPSHYDFMYCTIHVLYYMHVHVHVCTVVVNKLALEKYEVLWMADDTIFKQKKEITSQLWSMVGEKLGRGQLYGAARSALREHTHTHTHTHTGK